ncbi:MAG: hypothetical protein PHX50_17160, partial [Massilibacteroides sp.]|nr:hypothetical protein [Massilibacteroides sp.]
KLGAYSWGFTDDELKELTPSEENAANIALNKAQGDWDMDQLMVNLQELKDEDFDIELTGFDDIEFSQFIEDMNTLKTPIPESEREYDESIASDVEMITCPHCGEVFPK